MVCFGNAEQPPRTPEAPPPLPKTTRWGCSQGDGGNSPWKWKRQGETQRFPFSLLSWICTGKWGVNASFDVLTSSCLVEWGWWRVDDVCSTTCQTHLGTHVLLCTNISLEESFFLSLLKNLFNIQQPFQDSFILDTKSLNFFFEKTTSKQRKNTIHLFENLFSCGWKPQLIMSLLLQ